jgi:hypothetical protein
MKQILARDFHTALSRTACLIMALLFVGMSPFFISRPASAAPAFSPSDVYHIRNHTPFFDANACGYKDGKSLKTCFPDANACSGGATAGVGGGLATLSGGDNQQKIFNFFKSKGLNGAAAAGIMGNMRAESRFNPAAAQTPRAWEDLSSRNINHGGGGGVGLVQWDGGRRPAVIKYLMSQGLTDADFHKPSDKLLSGELGFVWKELSTSYKSSTLNRLKSVSNNVSGAGKAAFYFHKYYEGSADSAAQIHNNRVVPAQQLFKSLSNGHAFLGASGSASGSVGSSGGSCAGSSGAAGSVNCKGGSASGQSGLSQVRKKAVCLAEKQLVFWQKKGSKTPAQSCKKYDAGHGAGGWCEEWCADFTSWIYKNAGKPFVPVRIASVSEVQAMGQAGKGGWHYHSSSGYTPKPGDLAIHKGGGVSHINMVVNVSGTTVTEIGGDQGHGPYGGAHSRSDVSKHVWHGFSAYHTVGYVTPD